METGLSSRQPVNRLASDHPYDRPEPILADQTPSGNGRSGALLAGAIVTETIFSWPGIGRLTITAISNRDYYLVQGCILMIGLTYVLVNFLTDMLYSAFNPRIRQ